MLAELLSSFVLDIPAYHRSPVSYETKVQAPQGKPGLVSKVYLYLVMSRQYG